MIRMAAGKLGTYEILETVLGRAIIKRRSKWYRLSGTCDNFG
jgi:hypothetical protein